MSLRDRLLNRQRPSTTFRVRIDPSESGDAPAAAALEKLDAAEKSGDPDEITAAQMFVDQFYETLKLVALPPDEAEALQAAHPPSDAERVLGWGWSAGYIPALIAASVDTTGDDDPMTEQDWQILATKGGLARGEIVDLFRTCFELNDRSPDVRVGKDSRGPRS